MMELDSPFGRFSHKPLQLVCPICGKVHVKTRKKLALLNMILLFLFSIIPLQQAMAKAPEKEDAIGITQKEEAVILSPTPTPTPEPTATIEPTTPPLSIPNNGIIWGEHNSQTLFYQEPGQARIGSILNGTKVIIKGEYSDYGNIPWQQIETLDGLIGWVVVYDVFRLQDNHELLFYAGKDLYLWSTPEENPFKQILVNTPVRVLESTNEGWSRITLLDNTEGWVYIDLLFANPSDEGIIRE